MLLRCQRFGVKDWKRSDSSSLAASADMGLSYRHIAINADGPAPLSSLGISGVLHVSSLLLARSEQGASHFNMCNGLTYPGWTVGKTLYHLARRDSCEHKNCT